MDSTVFNRETLLDLSVNIIPLGIMVFFLALFVLANPWGMGDPLMYWLMVLIIGHMIVLLAVLTYYSGKAIESGEHADEMGH